MSAADISGVLGTFHTEAALRAAATELRGRGLGAVETYTPEALDPEGRGSVLPPVILAAGLGGTLCAFGLEAYDTVRAYPVDIGGRPAFSWPAYVPIAFEVGVLCAVAAGVITYFALARMPRLWEPVDECEGMALASRDRWCVALRSVDPALLSGARAVLRRHGAETVEEIRA